MFDSKLITSFTTIGIAVLLLVVVVLFFLSLQNTLKAVEPRNRTMTPGKVWLLFIPLFNIVWIFTVVAAIATSGRRQLEDYGVMSNGKPTYTVGLLWAISFICNRLPVVGVVFAFASLILFIIYWLKINALKNQILHLKEIYQNKEADSIL